MAVSIEQTLQKAKRLAKKGQNDLAAEQYKSILDAFPNNQRAIDGLRSLRPASAGIPQRGIPKGGYPQGGSPQRGFSSQRPNMPDRGQIERLIGLYNQGQLQQALTMAEELANKFPNALMVFNIMGAINAAMGNFESAVQSYSKARNIDPKIAEIHNNLGLALDSLQRHDEAIDSYNKAVKLKSNYAAAYNNLGLATFHSGRYKEAIDCYLKALKIEPNFAEAYNNIGLAQNRLHLHDKAVVSYNKAIKINAEISAVFRNKGTALVLMGKNEEAIISLKQALKLNNDIPDPELLYQFSELPANVIDIDVLSILEKFQAENDELDQLGTAGLNLVKARLLHNVGRFEEAWNILVTENKKIMKEFSSDFEIYTKNNLEYLGLLNSQTPLAPTQNQSDGKVPVSLFVLGPSRSGKSTLEHLIASSPKVELGYESSVIDSAIHFATKESDANSINYLDELPEKLHEKFKKHYLDIIQNFAEPGQIFVSTKPGVIQLINLATTILPNVRIVFLKRNIDDNVLRIFMKQYQNTNPYSYDIKHIREHIDWYNNMIEILHNRYPSTSIVIQYEDLVSDPQKTLQEISDLCEIDLSDGTYLAPGDDRDCAKPYLDWMANIA